MVNPFNPDEPEQRFELWGNDESICSLHHQQQVLDIAEGSTDEGATICLWDRHGGDNQKWLFEYK